MARRLKKCKKTKNLAKETSLPETEEEEKIEFDIAASSLAELLRLAEEYVPDPSKKTMVMTRREMNLYIKEKMTETTHKPPEINPFIDLHKQCRILRKEVEEKEQQVHKELKDFEIMYKNQLEVCKHLGIVPKKPAKIVDIEEIPVPERKFEGVDLTSD
ncbi:hypothetical protein TNIN_410531 [Trichonephila inaurata madagascariensis]|uniref:Uncharacterized protein n=1 Tax=Trichonephila inaurata madagascariensis TaxID=2747483 RepID=A0A8X6XLK8_9ARAC|nr:hypothetical protein TNIN_410531 [Trichonephila inaurata madagascariensis]